MLCAPLRFPTKQSIARANHSADLVELVVAGAETVRQYRPLIKKPVIFTYRSVSENLFSDLEFNPDYVDLPSTADSFYFSEIKRRFPHIQRICSYHGGKTPVHCEGLFKSLAERETEIIKVATYAHSSLDSLRMLQALKSCLKPAVGLCMGPLGQPTRILAPCFGSLWSYAPLSKKQMTAEGQLLLSELKGVYQYPQLSEKTEIFALIGAILDQSPGHRVHNYAFKQLGIDAVYLKIEVRPDEVDEFMCLAKSLGLRGLSITAPLKERIIQDRSVNTVAWHGDELLTTSTDGIGTCDVIEQYRPLRGGRLLMIGAGGAARSICEEAVKRGAILSIFNRTFSRAQFLEKNYGCKAFPLENLPHVLPEEFDILVNAASVDIPLPESWLVPGKIIMDIRHESALLSLAKKKGCISIKGIDLFIRQALQQYLFWFRNRIRG